MEIDYVISTQRRFLLGWYFWVRWFL